MWKSFYLLLIGLIPMVLFPLSLQCKEYVIFSIRQEVPMGIKGERLKKNYYLNLGGNQGVKEGVLLDVYRTLSVYNPYLGQGQYSNYEIKVGELSVIHADSETAIAGMTRLNLKEEGAPIVDINDFVIGDRVQIHLDLAKQ